jgi:glycosyl transferase family 25
MHTIIINLARATERRATMERQCAALGLIPEFLDATDGRALSDADRALVDHAARKRITPYPLSDNEIGCALSHRRAMQRIIDNNWPMAVIIEDDARLSSEFPAILSAIENVIFPFDVIDLHRKLKTDEIFIPLALLGQSNRLGRIGYTHMGCITYVVSRAGAERFLKSWPRMGHAVDKELHRYWHNGLDMFGVEYPVSEQNDGGYSFIDETRGQDRPNERPIYPDANRLHGRLQRRFTKLRDSFLKRRAFHSQIRKDKLRNWGE